MANKCPKCDTDNPSDSKYCKECATPLPSLEEIPASPTKTLETPTKELTRGTIFASRYEIIEELGKGGMGKVYRVEDKKIWGGKRGSLYHYGICVWRGFEEYDKDVWTVERGNSCEHCQTSM